MSRNTKQENQAAIMSRSVEMNSPVENEHRIQREESATYDRGVIDYINRDCH